MTIGMTECGYGDTRRDDNVDLTLDELGSNLGVAVASSLPPAILDSDCAVLDPSEFC